MNIAMAAQIISWGVKAVKAIWDVVQAAMQASDTVTLEQLKENVKKILDERQEDWVKEIRDEADKALLEAAAKAAEDKTP